jgi:hypothetical protein
LTNLYYHDYRGDGDAAAAAADDDDAELTRNMMI